jgi:hypothetical protein
VWWDDDDAGEVMRGEKAGRSRATESLHSAMQRISGNEKWVQFEGFWLPKTVKTRDELNIQGVL